MIYTIGLGNNPGLPPDQVLLARVANDPGSPSYNNKQAAGLSIFSANHCGPAQRLPPGGVRRSFAWPNKAGSSARERCFPDGCPPNMIKSGSRSSELALNIVPRLAGIQQHGNRIE